MRLAINRYEHEVLVQTSLLQYFFFFFLVQCGNSGMTTRKAITSESQ